MPVNVTITTNSTDPTFPFVRTDINKMIRLTCNAESKNAMNYTFVNLTDSTREVIKKGKENVLDLEFTSNSAESIKRYGCYVNDAEGKSQEVNTTVYVTNGIFSLVLFLLFKIGRVTTIIQSQKINKKILKCRFNTRVSRCQFQS